MQMQTVIVARTDTAVARNAYERTIAVRNVVLNKAVISARPLAMINVTISRQCRVILLIKSGGHGAAHSSGAGSKDWQTAR
jgi:hypothetical protein